MTAATDTERPLPRSSAISSALRWADRHPVALFGVLGVLVAGLYLVSLSTSPDFTADEVLYAQLSQNIVRFNAISLTGPFIVHPPLDFFLGALWTSITGTAGESTVSALASIRVFSAACCVAAALATGVLARDLLGASSSTRRVLAGVVATLLVATNGFMLSFGRTALLEPAAIAAGAGIVLAAYRLRHRPAAIQILVLGVLIGLGTLIKQTVLFVALAPLLAGALARARQRMLIAAAAVTVGGVIWSAFPIWAAVNGYSGSFWSQQSVSIRRLIGALHTSGVTLPNGSPLTQFLRTFGLYASGYASLFVGALALVTIVVRRRVLTRSPQLDDGICLVLAYGLISFGFLGYSFAFGAANQQFMMYSAPASALLCIALFFDLTSPGNYTDSTNDGDPNNDDSTNNDHSPNNDDSPNNDGDSTSGSKPGVVVSPESSTPRPVAAGLVIGLLLLLGALGWTRYYALEPDDGTATIAAYVQASVPRCVPINTSGSQPRWEAALPDNPVRFYRSGPEALRAGVDLFLLSPKDARYGYGNMTPELSNWITTNGRLLVQTPSRSSELLQLWVVGDVAAVPQTATCVSSGPAPSTSAPAGEFLVILGVVLLVVVTVGGWAVIASGRRATTVVPAPRNDSAAG